MRRRLACIYVLLVAGACDKPAETKTTIDDPEPTSEPSVALPQEAANMSATDFCKLVFEAPLRALDAACTAEDKKAKRHGKLAAEVRKRVQTCWSMLNTGVQQKRVTLPKTTAERCAAALEKLPWRETIDGSLDGVDACRTLAIGLSGAGKPCRSRLECSPGLFCSGATTAADGVCMKQVAVGDTCQSAAFDLFGEIEAACTSGSFCDHDGKLASVAPPPLPTNRYGLGEPGGAPARPKKKPPRVRMGKTNVSGRLPPEVIQRIVRSNFGRFRLCYENGLKSDPNLQGRVSVRFVIGRDGSVSSVSGSGDIPDQAVISCVTRAFYGLTFPQPEGGIVTVSYPIVFTPGEGRRRAGPSGPPPGVTLPSVTDTCLALRKSGDICRASRECEGELACVMAKCGKPLPEGADCWWATDCDEGLRCVTQPREESGESEEPPPITRKCEKVVAPGGACQADADCAGMCAEGVCKAFCGG